MGGMITSWGLKKQKMVALSSTEAEYYAYLNCCQEALFMQNMLYELFGKWLTVIIEEDNMGVIFLIKNQQVSAWTKHIDIHAHWIHDLQASNWVVPLYVRTDENLSDGLMKNSAEKLFTKHSTAMHTGTLPCWREDDKDTGHGSVNPLGSSVCPVMSINSGVAVMVNPGRELRESHSGRRDKPEQVKNDANTYKVQDDQAGWTLVVRKKAERAKRVKYLQR